jgi:hypothetical protein
MLHFVLLCLRQGLTIAVQVGLEFFYFRSVLGFELRSLHLLDKGSTT